MPLTTATLLLTEPGRLLRVRHSASSSPRSFTFLPLFLLLFLLFPTTTYARLDEVSVTKTYRTPYALAGVFGFEEGGTLTLDLQVTPSYSFMSGRSHFRVVLWNEEQQYNAVIRKTLHRLPVQPCTIPSVFRQQITTRFQGTTVVKERGRYYLYILDCFSTDGALAASKSTVNGTAHFINPPHQELSLDETPSVSISAFYAVLYMVVTVSWLFSATWHRKDMHTLQVMIFVPLALKTAECVITLYYYQVYSSSGHTNETMVTSIQSLRVVADVYFLFLILLIAMGWSLTRESLDIREKQLIGGALVTFGIFYMMYLQCSEPEHMCSAYMLSLYVVKFLVTFGVSVATQANIERLQAVILDRELSEANVEIHLLAMYRNLWGFFLAFLLVPMALLIAEYAVLSWDERWVTQALHQVLFMVVFAATAYAFRPLKNNPLFNNHLE